MNPKLQLNTGKLLNDSFLLFTGTGADETVLIGDVVEETGNIEVIRSSSNSIIEIYFSLSTALSVDSASGNEFLFINVFRNNTFLFSQSVNLFPVNTGSALGLFPVFITFSYYDTNPSEGANITGDPINYNIQFTTTNLGANGELAIRANSLVSFKEIESPNEIPFSGPLT